MKNRVQTEYSRNLRFELTQAGDEGKDVSAYVARVEEVIAMDENNPEKQLLAGAIFDEIEKLPVVEGHKYIEPSDLEGIKSQRPSKASEGYDVPEDSKLYDRLYGAWLGRCAGCLLGKPFEGWMRDRMTGLLKDTGNYPVNFYASSDLPPEIGQKYEMDKELHRAWINKVSYMPEDDDTNYTIIGLKIFEQYGKAFTPEDVAVSWLSDLPILHTYTAERVAYRNFIVGKYPPDSASYRNPYREWIGAQIRADFFGYVTPGNPELGAGYAWRDASISHTKNGIYGEMFVAAMLSAASTTCDIYKVIEAGLSQIPEKSRLTERVREVLQWKKDGVTWEQAIDKVHELYDEKTGHGWCHTISNAMLVCAGLIYGELDFEKSIGIAVTGAFDTDCNGATVGSIVGMMLGAGALPEKWIAPLNDQLKSGVDGFGLVRISDMAKRTLEAIQKSRQD